MSITIVDGPMGTQLIERGVPTPAPLWSAWALLNRPEEGKRIHREYAAAGATVHTANTFRTKRRSMGRTTGRSSDGSGSRGPPSIQTDVPSESWASPRPEGAAPSRAALTVHHHFGSPLRAS